MPSGVALISASLSTGAVSGRGREREPELDRQLRRRGHVARLDADEVDAEQLQRDERAARRAAAAEQGHAADAAPGLALAVDQGRDRADVGVGGEQFAVAHEQEVGRARRHRAVGRFLGEVERERA